VKEAAMRQVRCWGLLLGLQAVACGFSLSPAATAPKKGGLIAFTLRDQQGRLQIFTEELDGSHRRQLTFTGGEWASRLVARWEADRVRLHPGRPELGRRHGC
jgi:hypothetical protein